MSSSDTPRGELLRRVVELYRRFEPGSVSWAEWTAVREVSGELKASAGNLERAAELQKRNLLDTQASLAPRATGDHRVRVSLILGSLRSNEGTFAYDLDSMLRESIRFRLFAPEAFFLAESGRKDGTGYLHPDERSLASGQLLSYLRVQHLIHLLEEVADYRDRDGGTEKLVFKVHRTLDLPILYAATDLVALEAPETDARLGKMERLLQSQSHQDQIRDLLKTALIETLEGSEEQFVDLLHNFARFFQRFDDNYHLFISKFSFEKVREQAEEQRLAYTDKLNAVFAGIQSQLLGIPVALVVVASQMKDSGDAVLENLLILLGALVFAGLLLLLVANQRHTLEALRLEIERTRKTITHHKQIRQRLEDIYSGLEDRYLHHFRLLGWIELLVGFSVLLPLGVFLHYTYG